MSNREVIAWQVVEQEDREFLGTSITDKPRVAELWRDIGVKLRELVAKEDEKVAA